MQRKGNCAHPEGHVTRDKRVLRDIQDGKCRDQIAEEDEDDRRKAAKDLDVCRTKTPQDEGTSRARPAEEES